MTLALLAHDEAYERPVARVRVQVQGPYLGDFEELHARVANLLGLASRTLWRLVPLERTGPLLDLTDPEVTRDLHYSLSDATSRRRPVEQKLARRVYAATFKGIVHRLKEGGGAGVALFDKAGRGSGSGRWHTSSQPLLEAEDFWRWLDSDDDRHFVCLGQIT